MLRDLTNRLRRQHRTSPRAHLSVFARRLRARGFRPRHVIDVGANRAEWSRRVAQAFPEADYTLVEPQIEMKPHIEAFCSTVARARWLQMGVGGAMGTLTFTARPDDDTSSGFMEDQEVAEREGWERRKIDVVTLDHIAQEVIGAVPDIVKLDAEGMEREIMTGASSLVGETELFLLEIPFFDPRPGAADLLETVQFMAEYGYAPYDFTEFVMRTHDGALGLCEMVFARNEGTLRAYRGW